MKSDKLLKKLIGMSEEDAEFLCHKNGYKIRLSSRDGIFFPGTCEMRGDRINVTVAKGIVTEADVG